MIHFLKLTHCKMIVKKDAVVVNVGIVVVIIVVVFACVIVKLLRWPSIGFKTKDVLFSLL